MLNPITHKISKFWLLNSLGWSLYLLTLYIQTLLIRGELDFYSSVWRFLMVSVGMLLSTFMRQVYLKFNLKRETLPKLLGVILLTTLLAANVWYFLDIGLDFLMKTDDYSVYDYIFKNYIHLTFYWSLILLGWSALYFLIKLWIEWHEENKRSRNASVMAKSAQLQMLRYQLNPHFLFNSLNSIRALIEEDETDAQSMITELSEFLRYSLSEHESRDIPLRDELEAIRHYFSIEKKRFEDKLDIHFNVSADALDYPVIGFLLHPLVENAVKYGMQTSTMPLHIHIDAWLEAGCLRLKIKNSGHWMETRPSLQSPPCGTGTGLENIQNRLKNAFSNQYEMHIEKQENWVSVSIKVCRNSEAQTRGLL